IAALRAEHAREKGEVTAQVVSAQNMDDKQQAALAAALKSAIGKDVKLDLTEDPSIMGGLVITVGSKRIDSSIRSKLERLHRALKGSDASKDKSKMREVA